MNQIAEFWNFWCVCAFVHFFASNCQPSKFEKTRKSSARRREIRCCQYFSFLSLLAFTFRGTNWSVDWRKIASFTSLVRVVWFPSRIICFFWYFCPVSISNLPFNRVNFLVFGYQIKSMRKVSCSELLCYSSTSNVWNRLQDVWLQWRRRCRVRWIWKG